MAVLWLILGGISIFMLFFTFTEMSGTSAMFLSAGWFGVFFVCLFEAIGLFRSRTHRPSLDEERRAYYQRMVKLSARPRR